MDNEIIALSEYHNIIANLLENCCFDSLLKLEVTALLIKHYKDNNLLRSSPANHIKEFFSSFLTLLYSKSRDLKAINECLFILEKEGFVKIKNDNITKTKHIPYVSDVFMQKENIYETMEIINKLSISSFVEDLINYA